MDIRKHFKDVIDGVYEISEDTLLEGVMFMFILCDCINCDYETK